MKYKYPTNISEAAKILDDDTYYWYELVNKDLLDLNDCIDCILGQVYGSYDNGMFHLFGVSYPNDLLLRDDIFGCMTDIDNWLVEINNRLEGNK